MSCVTGDRLTKEGNKCTIKSMYPGSIIYVKPLYSFYM